ncbi:glycoside hydrolase family 3 protein [Brytella acorum]|uniref:Glycoside hydrolase family 3 C-terminal domain-containing protein n=1 Tax=Brytella acorum TaxID=2959299 RepID=A0AA35UL06_9PROT|nr:glycoside hydrolase family 3 protein [Brytella acorum]MDF3625211.1 glycoside hydrolase family 3 C-terminal domain-containing protein [Brytella acorum]CAI9119377.1 glycoside hydrolase family 3 C-terminal domain-containing protein [Brytella acorum]
MKAYVFVLLLVMMGSLRARADTIDDLVARMSVDEKIGQVQSSAPAIPRLGVAAYDWWSEGLHGAARNGAATVFPQAIGLAATFDPALVTQIGQDIGAEAREKFMVTGWHADHGRFDGLTLWSPNVNIFRDPRWGRGQETYGEDPWLAGELGAAFVSGMQGQDVARPVAAAAVKHFVAHSGPEPGRDSFDVDLAPSDLGNTYLRAFHRVTGAGSAGLMCSYNAVNGTPNCANPKLLHDVVRKQWGFGGYIVADCDAVMDITAFHHAVPTMAQASAAALKAGVDLDCGAAYAALKEALREKLVTEADLDRSLKRLLRLRAALGWTPGRASVAEVPVFPKDTRSAERHALALKAAEESLVLLSNPKGTLPISTQKIAVIGPDADSLPVLEGNYHGTVQDADTPLLALRHAIGAQRVVYAPGSVLASHVPQTVPETALVGGMLEAVFAHDDFASAPVVLQSARLVDVDWDRAPPAPGVATSHFSVRWSGVLSVPEGGAQLSVHVERCFDCAGHDPVRLEVDGRTVLTHAGDSQSDMVMAEPVAAGRHWVRLDVVHTGQDGGVRMQWQVEAVPQRREALAALAQADMAIAFLGLSPEVEGEALSVHAPGFLGGDRTEIELPEPQRALLDALMETGKPVVVVLHSGGAVALGPARERAAAVLAAWYPGEAGGEAIANVLLGQAEPGGRLPVTFYHATDDLPPFADYALSDMLGGRTYRYFSGKPDAPFGYGLGYGDVVFGQTHRAGKGFEVTLQNRGRRATTAVPELYIFPPGGEGRPGVELGGVQRVPLRVGESRVVRFDVLPEAFSFADVQGVMHRVTGTYQVAVLPAAPVAGKPPSGAATFSVGMGAP